MKVIATFDKSITEVLADKVKARLNFKVALVPCNITIDDAPDECS